MALHPLPMDRVPCGLFIECAPEVGVCDRLLRAGSPAVALPALDPLADALPDVLAVGIERDLARPLQRSQCLDDGGQFHAVVRRLRLAAEQFALVHPATQPGAPATGPGV